MSPAVRVATAPARSAPVSVPARGTVQLLAGRICFIGCGYTITVILARGLGPAEYGIYGVVISVLIAVEMAAGLGVPGATAKLIPENERDADAVARTANFLLLVGSVGLFVLFWTLAPLMARLLDIQAGAGLFRLAFLDLPLTGLYFAYQGTLYGHRRFDLLSVSLIVYGLAKLAGTVALVAVGLSVGRALFVNALATLGVVLYLVLRVPTAGLRPSYPLVSGLLRLAVPIGLYTVLLQTLVSVDLWVLKGLGTVAPAAVGGYVAALSVAKVLVAVPSVLSGIVFASVCRALACSDDAMARRQIQGAVRFALIVLAPSCVLIALNSEALMGAIYSRLYAGAGVLLGFQAAAFALLAFLDVLLLASMASGQYVRVTGLLAMLILLAVVANVALVGRLGAFGAAIGLAGVLAVGTAGAVALAVRRFGPVVRGATLVRVLAATLVLAVADGWVVLTGLWLALKFALLFGLYGVLLAISKELDEKDLGALALWRMRAV